MLQGWAYWFIALCAFNFFVLLWHARRTKRKLTEMQTESERIHNMDEKIFRLYQEIESMLDNFDAYVDEVHEEQEARRKELTEMSRQATTLYMQVMQPAAFGGLQGAKRPEPPEVPEIAPPPATYAKPELQLVPDGRADALRAKAEASRNKAAAGSKLVSRDRLELDRLTTKGQKIRYLMGRGLTLDEVARELGIGQGEIRLIVDLDKG